MQVKSDYEIGMSITNIDIQGHDPPNLDEYDFGLWDIII